MVKPSLYKNESIYYWIYFKHETNKLYQKNMHVSSALFFFSLLYPSSFGRRRLCVPFGKKGQDRYFDLVPASSLSLKARLLLSWLSSNMRFSLQTLSQIATKLAFFQLQNEISAKRLEVLLHLNEYQKLNHSMKPHLCCPWHHLLSSPSAAPIFIEKGKRTKVEPINMPP